MQALIYVQTRYVSMCMCIYYNGEQLFMCDVISHISHGEKHAPQSVHMAIHTNIEAPSVSHTGKILHIMSRVTCVLYSHTNPDKHVISF